MTTLPQLVLPFRGERYRAGDRLGHLIAPPYDVIHGSERDRYAAADPHNIVYLILPEAPVGMDRYAHAAVHLDRWRSEGVLAADAGPAVYVVAQDYVVPGRAEERRTRIGMFAAVAAESYDTRRIRPHERTHSGPKADRLALLRATRTSLESIFLLAPDPEGSLDRALRQAAGKAPDATAELDGVGIRLWVVTGDSAERLAALASRDRLYIADGHHRFETAVAYARENPKADRVLSFIVSADDPGLTVLPTHRIIFATGRDVAALTEKWRRWFEVRAVSPDADHVADLARLGKERPACILALPGGNDIGLVLKPDAPLTDVPLLGKSEAARRLDVAIIEALVVKEILTAGTSTPTLTYTPDARQAIAAVVRGSATTAVLLNPPTVQQVFAVADAGDVMPPKSTYFVPKVPSGLVLRPLA